jgi:wobble nucleotide-excising tRNase
MLLKLNIQKFGLFENFEWNREIGNDQTFRKLNIIYGRNYSGKTTLSRAFRSLETKELHKNYTDAKFQFEFNDGASINQSQLLSSSLPQNIRVYNTDFVNDNLSWLYNEDGSIQPFTVLGAKNVELEREIAAIDDELGNEETEKGLLHLLNLKKVEHGLKSKAHTNRANALNDKLKAKAQNIKNEAITYNYPTYQITHIRADIQKIKDDTILSEEVRIQKQKLLNESPKQQLSRINELRPEFQNYVQTTKDLVERKILLTDQISELVEDSILQEWVRKGAEIHRDKKTVCGFCGNALPEDLWKRIDAHFSKESEELRSQLDKHIQFFEQSKIQVSGALVIEENNFYDSLRTEVIQLKSDWKAEVKKYSGAIDQLIGQLKTRKENIFNDLEFVNAEDFSELLFQKLQKINELIEKHNSKTATLTKEQEAARNSLRMSEVAKFVKEINYVDEVKTIAELEESFKKAGSEQKELDYKVDQLRQLKRRKEDESKDESKGAQLVDKYLTHFFGHNELKLEAFKEDSIIRFKITRNGVDAKNLSEGECSLISFCYFIARLNDELSDDTRASQLIIYIDDPISSLDSNHVFFIFSLIESVIAKPKKYGQLFISTHNLNFLKYLKRLTNPEKNTPLKQFLIERKNKSISTLSVSPKYLSKFITEFNYLFAQIYNCSQLDTTTITTHDYQYGFGNNLRKFLEAYLFYKYPTTKMKLAERVEKYFAPDSISINLINRAINEFSHLEEYVDRGLEPIDLNEIITISQFVLNKMNSSDPDQYNALLESVNDLIEE